MSLTMKDNDVVAVRLSLFTAELTAVRFALYWATMVIKYLYAVAWPKYLTY